MYTESQLAHEINKFRHWASTQEDKSAEWETHFDGWDAIYKAFEEFIVDGSFFKWNKETIDPILYIIARDNEMEVLADIVGTDEGLLLFLAEKAVTEGEPDAQWQLAVRLKTWSNKEAAESLLLAFTQTKDEYVCRRVLMALADIGSNRTELLCPMAWQVGGEYMRMAVLYALFTIKSSNLPHYIQMAKEDGREYLLKKALEIEKSLNGTI